MAGSLTGAAALVTGAASGIGRATALLLGQHGARVALADRNLAGAEETCGAIAAAGGTAVAIEVEVGNSASVDRMVESTVRSFGQLDVLVHCAAILKIAPVVETSDEDWRRVIDVNLNGSFFAARAAARAMIPRGSGRIVLITSGRGASGAPRNAAYASAKGGVNALTFSLARELFPSGILVNALDPGSTETPLMRSVPGELHSVRAPGKPEEVAETILFLASNQSGMTGQIVSIRMR